MKLTVRQIDKLISSLEAQFLSGFFWQCAMVLPKSSQKKINKLHNHSNMLRLKDLEGLTNLRKKYE